MYTIPFNRPCFQGKELEYIREAIESGQISPDGKYTRRCSELLEEELGVGKALLTPSCTHALEMAALLLDIRPGDEVIVPSFTFVSSVNAFVLRGAKPVFIDIRPDTLNLDETLLESLITKKTKAIVPVHYGGVGCEMDAIMKIAGEHGVPVVEDNAHGLFAQYRQKPLGTFGALATLSFHETKNVTCGQGGALLINDERYIERAHVIRDKGTDRQKFLRGETDKYTWVDLGSSYALSELAAAFLWAQLEARENILSARKDIWRRYNDGLASWADRSEIGLPTVPQNCDQAYHLYYLVLPSSGARDALIDSLKAQGILAVFHYLPLHLSSMGQKYGGRPGDCPITENLSERILRLPFYNDMTEAEQAAVIKAVTSISR